MIFLLDTDTCSAHMRRPARLAHRFIQYTGGLAISTIVLGKLYAGAYKHPNPAKLLTVIANLLREVDVLDFDPPCAHEFGFVSVPILVLSVQTNSCQSERRSSRPTAPPRSVGHCSNRRSTRQCRERHRPEPASGHAEMPPT